jgi:hypothetical protein
MKLLIMQFSPTSKRTKNYISKQNLKKNRSMEILILRTNSFITSFKLNNCVHLWCVFVTPGWWGHGKMRNAETAEQSNKNTASHVIH